MAEKEGFTRLAAGEADYTLPDLREYKPHGNATVKPCYTLHVIIDGKVQSYPNNLMDAYSTFETRDKVNHIRVTFGGASIAMEGRNLWRVYDLLHQHRLPWIWKAERDFAEDNEPILTGIEAGEIEEE